MTKNITLQEFDPHIEDRVECQLTETDTGFEVSFSVPNFESWDLESEHGFGDFIVGLWEHSCFELFEFKDGDLHYAEWNFSPTGAYWYCEFEDYRKKSDAFSMRSMEHFKIEKMDGYYKIIVKIPKAFSKSTVQLNCILKDLEGRLYYFAERHPAHKADFHLKLL